MRFKTFFISAFLLLASATAVRAGTVSVKGSDTMVILGQRWAEEFMKKNPDTTITVTGGGSGTGIAALIGGTADICQSSRAMKAPEKAKLRDRYNTTGVELPVAKDGLSIYVNSANPINELTIDQIKQIFTGKVTNWKDVGGPDAKIIPYSRENSSGTYVFFKDNVLGGADLAARAQTMPGTGVVVNAVTKEKNGIGYGGAAYAKGIKIVKIKKDASAPAIAPSPETVKAGTYALARPLFFYVRNKPAGDIKTFIDWVLSDEGQAIASKVGYYPLK